MFFILQAVMILYALASAWQESSVVKAFIDYVPINNRRVKGFHTAGAWMTVIVAVILSYHLRTTAYQIESFTLCLLWYWVVFDIALNVRLRGWRHWSYIGSTSAIDKLLHRTFPHGDAGEVKAIVCGIVIAVLNLLYSIV